MTYQEFKEAVIRYAVENGIADYELYYEGGWSDSVEIYKEEVKGYTTEENMGVCFRCIIGGKAGYASTENLTEEEARSLVSRALENAGSIESEEECFIHKKGDSYAVCEKNDSPRPSGAELVETALALQKELYRADRRVVDGTQAYIVYGSQKYALCNSNGLDLEDEFSMANSYGMAIVEDNGEMYDGFKVKDGRTIQELDLKEIAGEAVEEAVSTIGAGSIPSGKYTVVFSNKAMATLLATYSSVFSAEQAQKGMSLLKDKEGEKIAADIVTITDDPRYKDSMVKRTFDGEGVAAYAKNVVENGVLATLLHNLKTAAKAGVKSTGNASKASYSSVVGVSPFTFYLHPSQGEGSALEDIFRAAGEGLYITDLEGLHAGANPVSGDFSLSSKGFLITEGKKGAPVKNITVSGSFFELLKKVEIIGNDLELLRGKFGSPAILVRDMAVAGKDI
ncbi:MAG: TldD/PmbA family protein [Lachnospiraceae bacterium]|jgi:PmbA protein|nr:TldD/PmbA family protein [Lachnospiraceae bacterium]